MGSEVKFNYNYVGHQLAELLLVSPSKLSGNSLTHCLRMFKVAVIGHKNYIGHKNFSWQF